MPPYHLAWISYQPSCHASPNLGCPEPATPYVSLLTVFTYATFAMGATILAVMAMRHYGSVVKPLLVRRWAKDIAKRMPPVGRGSGNICDHAKPFNITMRRLRTELPGTLLANTSAADAVIRRRYYDVIDLWCRDNLQHGYYLWIDDGGVSLIMTEQADLFLWTLAWGEGMPSPSEVVAYEDIE